MNRIAGGAGTLVLLMTVGLGVVQADPANVNSRYFMANCEGETVHFVTMQGAAALDLDDTRIGVLQGVMINGQWVLPLSNGASKQELTTCAYSSPTGESIVIWVHLTGRLPV